MIFTNVALSKSFYNKNTIDSSRVLLFDDYLSHEFFRDDFIKWLLFRILFLSHFQNQNDNNEEL